MQHFQFIKRKWPISIRHSQKIIMIEITDEVPRDDFAEIVSMAFHGYPNVAISQYIDTGQSKISEKPIYLDGLAKKHGVAVASTKTYTEPEDTATISPVYVMHILGDPKKDVILDVLKFGMTSLSNIIYGVYDKKDNWVSNLISWNKEIVGWFELTKEIDDDFIDLINTIGLVAVTIDGHLFFLFTEISHLDNLLTTVGNVSKKNKLKLDIRFVGI